MIVFESLLTAFGLSSLFCDNRGISKKNCSRLDQTKLKLVEISDKKCELNNKLVLVSKPPKVGLLERIFPAFDGESVEPGEDELRVEGGVLLRGQVDHVVYKLLFSMLESSYRIKMIWIWICKITFYYVRNFYKFAKEH